MPINTYLYTDLNCGNSSAIPDLRVKYKAFLNVSNLFNNCCNAYTWRTAGVKIVVSKIPVNAAELSI